MGPNNHGGGDEPQQIKVIVTPSCTGGGNREIRKGNNGIPYCYLPLTAACFDDRAAREGLHRTRTELRRVPLI